MTYRLLIDGRLTNGAMDLDVINPATGKTFATTARADTTQLDQAIAAAKKAFPTWAALTHAERRGYLHRLADALEARQDEFTNLLTREQGKPLAQAAFEVGGSVAGLRHFGDIEIPVSKIRDTLDGRILEQHSPLGVIAAIAPWNFPLILMVLKIAPALSTGNTVVAKPAPTTPLTTVLFGEIAANILPAGVLNVIVDNNDLGAALTSHPDVAKVSFTGSAATGKRVMASAADTLKRLTLELGGNDVAIVLDDADVSVAAGRVFDAAMLNAGQICLAPKRIYVPKKIYEEFNAALARKAHDAVVDDGLNQGAQIGPVQNRKQYDRVLELIAEASKDGKVVAGGEAIARDGYFIAPTIISDLRDDARLVREEQFGPVIPVLSYETVDEVVDRANDSEYGLGGTIWTSNPERGLEIALRIQTGTVWVNKFLDMPFDIPFGGAKSSGFGFSNGIEGVKEFTQTKIINIADNLAA